MVNTRFTSAKKIRGLSKCLLLEAHPLVNGKRTDVYTYLVPPELKQKAIDAGAVEVKNTVVDGEI